MNCLRWGSLLFCSLLGLNDVSLCCFEFLKGHFLGFTKCSYPHWCFASPGPKSFMFTIMVFWLNDITFSKRFCFFGKFLASSKSVGRLWRSDLLRPCSDKIFCIFTFALVRFSLLANSFSIRRCCASSSEVFNALKFRFISFSYIN